MSSAATHALRAPGFTPTAGLRSAATKCRMQDTLEEFCEFGVPVSQPDCCRELPSEHVRALAVLQLWLERGIPYLPGNVCSWGLPMPKGNGGTTPPAATSSTRGHVALSRTDYALGTLARCTAHAYQHSNPQLPQLLVDTDVTASTFGSSPPSPQLPLLSICSYAVRCGCPHRTLPFGRNTVRLGGAEGCCHDHARSHDTRVGAQHGHCPDRGQ